MSEAELRPQLRMVRPHLNELPEPALPAPLKLRVYQPGDEALWVGVLNENGQLGKWDLARAESAFRGSGWVWRESIHLIMHGERAVATACMQLHKARPDLPELGWVAVVPQWQRQGLGRAVSLFVLHFMKRQGYQHCILRTDDFRLPAIQTYLRLGFWPELSHPSFPDRWQAVFAQLRPPV